MEATYFPDAEVCSSHISVMDHKVQVFEPCQVDFWAPENPIIYGLITATNAVYVGGTRNPKQRLRTHLNHSSSHPPRWAVRYVQNNRVPKNVEAKKEATPLIEAARYLQIGTRWFVLQMFATGCSDDEIAEGEFNWMKELKPELNSKNHTAPYSSKRSSSSIVQSPVSILPEKVALPPNPWETPYKVCSLSVTQNMVDCVAELIDLAQWCFERGNVPPDLDVISSCETAQELVYDYDEKICRLNRYKRRGFDSNFKDISCHVSAQSKNGMEAA